MRDRLARDRMAKDRAGKDWTGKDRAGKDRAGKDRTKRLRGCKERGEWAELCFSVRATEEGLLVLRHWGESARYDVGVDYGRRYSRVQVKSTEYKRRGESYSLNVMGPKRLAYREGDIDFVAVFLIPVDAWYIVPFERMKGKNGRLCSIHFTWGSPRQKYGEFLEAWHLLRGEKRGCS